MEKHPEATWRTALSRTTVQPAASNGSSGWHWIPDDAGHRLSALVSRPRRHPGPAGLPTHPTVRRYIARHPRMHPIRFISGMSRPEVVALVPDDRPAGARHRLRGGAAGRGDQAAQAGERLGHRARCARPPRQRGSGWTTSGRATSSGWTCQIRPGSFDAIVCADVLEHLREPGRLLKQAREWLSPDGRLIASIPNVRHHSVVRSLLARELDLRISRAARPHASAVLHPPRDREALPPRRVRNRGDVVGERAGR